MPELYPLTSLQETMVLATIRAPRSGVYMLQGVCELAEELNVPLLERAWRFSESFRSVVFAQVRISAINTFFTALFLLVALPLVGVYLPLTKTMIGFTFVLTTITEHS